MQPGDTISSQRRLAALAASGLLDSPPERRFDRLTRVVAAALRVPASMISLVDAERQFFKSAVGLQEPWAERRETPLTHSFCRHVVESEAPLIIDDARTHPLVADNPAIDELGVAAYLGIPIADRDGVVFGSLCAIDSAARHWTAADEQILTDVAALVEREIAERHETDAILESSRMWQAILNSLPQLVWAADAHGMGDGFNDRWHDYAGSVAGAGVQDWSDYCHPDDREAAWQGWQQALRTGAPYEGEFRLRNHAGDYHAMLARAVPLRDAGGAIERWFGSCTDIQSLKNSQAASDLIREELLGDLIGRLSDRAAYARREEFDQLRSLIASLRQLQAP